MKDLGRISESFGKLAAAKSFQVVAGTLAGIIIILLAVAVSALVFGAYGWGLFVLTPFTVGLTTGYLVNRREGLTENQTATTKQG